MPAEQRREQVLFVAVGDGDQRPCVAHLFALEQVGEESLLLQESVRPTDRPVDRYGAINVRIQVFRVLP